LREVEKYPSIVGFDSGTLALIANVLTNFAERTEQRALININQMQGRLHDPQDSSLPAVLLPPQKIV